MALPEDHSCPQPSPLGKGREYGELCGSEGEDRVSFLWPLVLQTTSVPPWGSHDEGKGFWASDPKVRGHT